MDSFLRLYALYRGITRWRIVVQIYRCADFPWKIMMWLGKLLFVLFAAIQFVLNTPLLCILLLPLSASIWAYSFERSRRILFSERCRLYPERMRYFSYNYQYIRYLNFREKMQDNFSGSIEDAICFLNEQIETESKISISTHPIITVLIASTVAIVGAAASQWSAQYIVGSLLLLIFGLYFSCMVLGSLYTPQSNLKEFKRFLIWARDEQLEN